MTPEELVTSLLPSVVSIQWDEGWMIHPIKDGALYGTLTDYCKSESLAWKEAAEIIVILKQSGTLKKIR